MIDVAKIKYCLNMMDGAGVQYNITDFVENLGWEENERELASRISFTIKNEKTKMGYLSSIAKPGCLVRVSATDGKTLNKEVARGIIMDWRPTTYGIKDSLQIKAYDQLYYLQRSQDNMYFPESQKTEDIIRQIFSTWNIPLESYHGPNETHKVLPFKSKAISDMIAEVLDDAVKAGGIKVIIRSEEGKVYILPWGVNEPIYYFDQENTMMQDHAKSIAQLVTRVKIFAQTKSEEKPIFEKNLDGKTEYGVFQKIYNRNKEETDEEVTTAAQEILKEQGDLNETITIQAPDVPFIRKGDMVYVKSGTLNDYFLVSGVRHDADIRKMTMDLKRKENK
jgi:hypothetical protein